MPAPRATTTAMMRSRYAAMRPIIGPQPASGKIGGAGLDEASVQLADGLVGPIAWNHPGDSKRRGSGSGGCGDRLRQRFLAGAHILVGEVDPRPHNTDRPQPVHQARAPRESLLERRFQVRLVVEVLARDGNLRLA